MPKKAPVSSKRATKGTTVAALAATIVMTASISLYPCKAGETKEVAVNAAKLVEEVTAKKHIGLSDLVSQIKSLGVTGVVIHDNDILFTHDVYKEKATYTEFGAVIMMRTNQAGTMDSLRKLLGKAISLGENGEYYKLT